MNTDFESIVCKYPLLSIKENKGSRHRIMHSGVSNGSLWIRPRKRDENYRVLISGDVDQLLGYYLGVCRV